MNTALAIAIALLAGLAMAVQTPTNGSLGVLCAVERSSVVNFLGGWLLLALLVALAGTGDLALAAHAPWWQLLGGVYGIYIVLAVSAATPVLGVALTLMAVMFGQLTAGMVIDTLGLLDVARLPFSPLRAAGCLAVAVGIAFVYVSRWKLGKAAAIGRVAASEVAVRKNAAGDAAVGKVAIGETAAGEARQGGASARNVAGRRGDAARAVRYLLLVLAAGVVSSMQSPTNTALSRRVGSLEASFVNFSVGLVIACVVLAVRCVRRGEKPVPPRSVLRRTRPWQYVGGLYGMVIVIAAILATPAIGVGLLMACEMLGQLAGGMVIDGLGLLRTPKVRLDGWRLGGVAWIALGIVLVTLARL